MQNDAKRQKLTNQKPKIGERQKLTNQKPKIGERQKLTRTQRNEDVILILKAIIKFKAKHGGSNPSLCNMKRLYKSIKSKLHQYFDYKTLYRKITAIKTKYEKTLIDGVGPTEHDHEMFQLSVRVWDQDGEVKKKKKKARKIEAACNDCGRLKDVVSKHCENNGLSKKIMEMGLEVMNKETRRMLERKWRSFTSRNAKVKTGRLELEKEIRDFMDPELGEGETESEHADEVVDDGEGSDANESSDGSEGADDSDGDM